MPASLVIGVGCTRGTPCSVLAAGIDAILARHALDRRAVRALATLADKRDEPGLCALARARGWELALYDAEALAAVPIAHPSEVVRRGVGTPAVAEPAARLCAGPGGVLRVPKTVYAAEGHAITVAVAVRGEPARDA